MSTKEEIEGCMLRKVSSSELEVRNDNAAVTKVVVVPPYAVSPRTYTSASQTVCYGTLVYYKSFLDVHNSAKFSKWQFVCRKTKKFEKPCYTLKL
jgi:hypothetical protein